MIVSMMSSRQIFVLLTVTDTVPTAKVRGLFDSMYRDYQVGELKSCDVPAEGETRAIQ